MKCNQRSRCCSITSECFTLAKVNHRLIYVFAQANKLIKLTFLALIKIITSLILKKTYVSIY